MSAAPQVTGGADAVPELTGQVMLSDTGIETDLIFNQGVDLPLFAAFTLAATSGGRDRLADWHRAHALVAIEHGLGASLDAATWRASSDWGDRLGYDAAELDHANQAMVAALHSLRAELPSGELPVRVGGTIGPRSDGYASALVMDPGQAQDYHVPQIRSLAGAGAERAIALTLAYVDEAIGFTTAASSYGLAAIVGFTVGTDGRLPDGTPLSAAISAVDAATGAAPAGYLVNCAHPDHVEPAVSGPGPWDRLIGFRPNASRRSHADMDAASDLDVGDPDELGSQVAALRSAHPSVALVGGCCGSDIRHARAIAAAVRAEVTPPSA